MNLHDQLCPAYEAEWADCICNDIAIARTRGLADGREQLRRIINNGHASDCPRAIVGKIRRVEATPPVCTCGWESEFDDDLAQMRAAEIA